MNTNKGRSVARPGGMTMGDPVARESLPRSRGFASAQRHSRFVRFAKLAIPLGSVLAVALVSLYAYFDPFRHIPGLTIGKIGVSGTQVTMESPKLNGFRNDSRPYEVTASQATQDVLKPNFVELKDLRARIVTDDNGNAARLEAAFGVLNTEKEQMNLRQDVRVRTDAGQEVRLKSAFVDFKAGTVVSDEPVSVSLGNGVIEATGLDVSDNGKIMHFRGRVRAVFQNESDSAPKTPPAGPAAPAAPAQPTSSRS
ncbi:LPS export ABC transporter periplasmic protein LptC [Microvirga antarctica]|uniref:LPS export ABC transporter periplasmic protein LptC n=1 Tax=Microvirga antarctica TaxID=2819233 RepID=UPI001B3049A4|nr:LPS export ABC transporter periplasmic protein LptC [Microvirga antarctica]